MVSLISSVTGSTLSVLPSLKMEISFNKYMSLGIGGKMKLKKTSVSHILVLISLSVVEKGQSKAKKRFPKLTSEIIYQLKGKVSREENL